MPEPDRDKTNVGSGLSLGLISPSPPHGQDTRRCRLSHLTKRRQRPVLARGLMLALGSPIVKPVRAKSSGSSQGHSQHTARFQRFRALKPRHQQLHALRVPWTLGYARSPLRLW